MENLYLILAVLILSTSFQATFGFGSALIAVPLLVNLTPLENITPLLALISLSIATPIVIQKRKEIDVKLIRPLLISAIVGVPLGIYLLTSLSPDIVKVCLGIVVLIASLLGLFALPEDWQISPRSAPIFGFIAGVLGGAYNLSGTPLVLFMTLSKLQTQTFRASMHFFSVTLNIFVVLGYVLSGNFSGDILRIYLFAIPIMVASVPLGNYASGRFNNDNFRKIVYGLLFVSGSFLIYSSLGN